MTLSRRKSLKLGLAAGAGAILLPSIPARAQSNSPLAGDAYSFQDANVVVHPVRHASLVLSINNLIIYVDPVGRMSNYENLPPPDLVLVTHEHSDHFNTQVLQALTKNTVPLITNPAVFGMLADDLVRIASPMGNGDMSNFKNIFIEAVPAYNLAPDRQRFHPPGRDNGYVLGVGGARIYIAGDTEDVPEMRALKDIDISFIPMVLPFTMDAQNAVSAVIEFAPTTVYPYHYAPDEFAKFNELMDAVGGEIDVRSGKWY